MSFLVIGGSGLVGYDFYRLFNDRIDWHFTYLQNSIGGERSVRLDATDAESVKSVLESISPKTIIITAALPNVNLCQQEPEKSRKLNVELVENVINAAKKHDSKLVFFSTDYLFDGKCGPYDEDAEPNPLNVYGRHKLEAENLIRGCGLSHLIIRTTGVYGIEKNRKNFLYRVNDTLKTGKELVLPMDMCSSTIYSTDLASITEKLCAAKRSGVYNVVGAEYLSRYELAILFAGLLGFDTKLIKPVKYDPKNDVAPRPMKGGLKNQKLSNVGLFVRTIPEAIADIIEKGGLNRA